MDAAQEAMKLRREDVAMDDVAEARACVNVIETSKGQVKPLGRNPVKDVAYWSRPSPKPFCPGSAREGPLFVSSFGFFFDAGAAAPQCPEL